MPIEDYVTVEPVLPGGHAGYCVRLVVDDEKMTIGCMWGSKRNADFYRKTVVSALRKIAVRSMKDRVCDAN